MRRCTRRLCKEVLKYTAVGNAVESPKVVDILTCLDNIEKIWR